MNKQQFIVWWNTVVWNRPKNAPAPSNADAVHCDCGRKQCIGKHPCQGWVFVKHEQPARVPNMGRYDLIVYATISQPEKPTWRSENQKRDERQRRQQKRERFQQRSRDSTQRK